ncbi:MAG: hypothetical protein AAGK14_11770 [Verrucomicrobiota bacterium]
MIPLTDLLRRFACPSRWLALVVMLPVLASAQEADPFAGIDSGGEDLDPAEQKAQLIELVQAVDEYLGPENSAKRLAAAAQDNPALLDPLTDGSQQFYNGLVVAAFESMSLNLLPMLGVVFLSFFASAWAVSRFLAPRHATLRNALIFASIPTVFGLVNILLTQLQSPAVTLLGTVIISLAVFVSLIIATMYLYDVGFLTMLLFGIIGSVLQSVLSSILAAVLFALIGQSMIGPVFDAVGRQYTAQALPMVEKRVAELEPRQRELAEEVAQAQARLDELQVKEAEVREELKARQNEVASKRQTPQLVYTSIGQLVDQNRNREAIASYAEFAAKFPGHPLAEAAKKQIDALESREAEVVAEREAAQAQAAEAQAKSLEEFKRKLAAAEVSLSDIRTALLGKPREEVIELLGQPDAEQANTLIYTRIEVYDPIRRRNRRIIVNFLDRRVQGVSYIR